MKFRNEVSQEWADLDFKSEQDFLDYVNQESIVDYLKEKYEDKLPAWFEFKIEGQACYWDGMYEKQGIPMDWDFFSGQAEIIQKSIEEEENIEKRRLLMMEYGINKYLQNVQTLQTDAYGTLIQAEILGEDQKFVKVRNGTREPIENWAYLKERGMLTYDNHKIYYIPVPDEIRTAKEGIAWSWDISKDCLPEKGWDEES